MTESHASSSAETSDDRASSMDLLDAWLARATEGLDAGVAERIRLETERQALDAMMNRGFNEAAAVGLLGSPETANRDFRSTCLDERRARRVRRQYGPSKHMHKIRYSLLTVTTLFALVAMVAFPRFIVPILIILAITIGGDIVYARWFFRKLSIIRSDSRLEAAEAFRDILRKPMPFMAIFLLLGGLCFQWILADAIPGFANVGGMIGATTGAMLYQTYVWATLTEHADDCVAIIKRAWDEAEESGDV